MKMPIFYEDAINNIIPRNTNNTLNTEDFSTTFNSVVGKVLMALVGVGLNGDNCEKYETKPAKAVYT